MIVLWGVLEDPPLAAVHERLRSCGAPTTLINQRLVAECRFESSLADGRLEGEIAWPGGQLRLETASAIYARPYDFTHLPQFSGEARSGEAFLRAARFEDAMSLWCELSDGLVINRPSAAAANGSKPYQSLAIGALGFRVPETLITTEPERVVEFIGRHGQVIYKSISGRRSIVSRLGADDIHRLTDVAACPTQFQAFIPGTDHRVHVLGDRVFACRIISGADDYRYSPETSMAAVRLPRDVEERCVALARALHLEFAGVDLRETPDGDWCCFEVNPSPGYTYFHAGSDQIADALTTRLMTA